MKRKINTELISRSHIHDAINLFNLVKAELNELEITETNHKQIKKIKTLVDSSVNHFKEVFESLDHKNSDLYLKTKVDLKDLLDLEIFDAFKDNRLIIEDRVKQNNALINGNFPLLSKALLNLIENSLKISKSTIKVSLEDESKFWTIKIHTPDQAFKEYLAESLEKLSPISSRHGLKSVSEILKYHGAKLEVINLYSGENSILLEFPKLITENKKERIFKQKPKLRNSKLSKLAVIFLLFISVFLSLKAFKEYRYKQKLTPIAQLESKQINKTKESLRHKLQDLKNSKPPNLKGFNETTSLNNFETKHLIYENYLKMDYLTKSELKLIKDHSNNFYEYHFLKARALKQKKKYLQSNYENLIALSLKLKSFLGCNLEEELIRKESVETISRLILYHKDQEL